MAVSAASDERCRINVGELTADEGHADALGRALDPGGEHGAPRRCWRSASSACRCCCSSPIARWSQQIALGQTVDGALDWALRKYKDLGVVAFDEKNATVRHDAVGNTVEVSLGFLADERQRCLELGVLHEDTDVPFSVLGTLWGLKETPVQVWRSGSTISA